MKNDLLVVSSCKDRVASWMQGLIDNASTALVIDSMEELIDNIAQVKPKVLLLDYALVGSHDVASLRMICTETQTIIIGSAITEEVEWKLLKAGIRGYCRNDIEPQSLKQVVMAVQDGELWIRRTLTSRLIDELGSTTEKNKAFRASLGLLNKLTQREYDIAVRVGNGENNKQIAKSCGITERTVKAHLTEVFQKLGVTDRLNLALVLSADDRKNESENLERALVADIDLNRRRLERHPNPQIG